MENWLIICINSKERLRVKVAESGNFAFKEKYLVKNIALDDIVNKMLIPIDVYLKDHESANASEILHKKTILERNKSILQFLDNFIGIFASSKSIPIEVAINKTQDGINVGFMSARYKSTHVHVPMTLNGEGARTNPTGNLLKAKDIFISNISSLSKPIRETWSNRTSLSVGAINRLWIECIKEMNNSSELLFLYESCNSNLDIWRNIVESWGLKMDKCKKYPYLLINKSFYDFMSEEDNSAQYDVVEPCITIWTVDAGKKKEICVLKGKVKICQS